MAIEMTNKLLVHRSMHKRPSGKILTGRTAVKNINSLEPIERSLGNAHIIFDLRKRDDNDSDYEEIRYVIVSPVINFVST